MTDVVAFGLVLRRFCCCAGCESIVHRSMDQFSAEAVELVRSAGEGLGSVELSTRANAWGQGLFVHGRHPETGATLVWAYGGPRGRWEAFAIGSEEAALTPELTRIGEADRVVHEYFGLAGIPKREIVASLR